MSVWLDMPSMRLTAPTDSAAAWTVRVRLVIARRFGAVGVDEPLDLRRMLA